MALWLYFKPKQVGKGRERGKIEIIVPFCSDPTRNRKFQKNSIKIQKIKKQCYGFILSQNRLEKAENERKQKLSFHSIPTRHVIENSKKIAKKFKKLKNSVMVLFQSKIEKMKIVVPFRSYQPRNRKFQKNSQKIKKNTIMA